MLAQSLISNRPELKHIDLMQVVIFVYPLYNLELVIKLITATSSIVTIFLLVRETPKFLLIVKMWNMLKQQEEEIGKIKRA